MEHPRRTPQAEFLYATRLVLKLDHDEAGQIVRSSGRSWAAWESGARPMPEAKMALLQAQLEGRTDSEGQPLCVVVQMINGRPFPLDVISPVNFVSGKWGASGSFILKTLGFDGTNPYIRRRELDPTQNAHTIKAAEAWTAQAGD